MKLCVLGFLFSQDYSKTALIRKMHHKHQKNEVNGFLGELKLEDLTPLDAMVRVFRESTGITYPNRFWENSGSITDSEFNVIVFKCILNPSLEFVFDSLKATDGEVVVCDPFSLPSDAPHYLPEIVQKLALGKYLK